MKKLLLLLIVLMLSLSTAIFISCGNNVDDSSLLPNDIPVEELFKDANMKEIYSIYCDYAEEMQLEVISFDEWFELVNGDEFEIGVIPEIRENIENGYWEISYNNGNGWNSLHFKTQNEMQKNCNHTFEKWITLLENNDYFNGIRYRECIDCGYKQYDFKLKHKLELVEVVESTCISNGYYLWKCKDKKCDFSYKEELPLGKHKYEDGVCVFCGEMAEKHTSYEYFVFIPQWDGTYAIAAKDNANMPANVILPTTYENKPVTTILGEGFWGCDTIKTIVIPEGYKEIENAAFYGCDLLNTVEISKTVQKIGDEFLIYAENNCEPSFSNCSSLKRIEVDEENQYYTSIQGNLYSKDKKTLIQYTIGKPRTYFEIPDFVTSISDCAFNGADFLTSITIPDSVTSIGLYSFYSCSSLRYKTKDNIKYLGNDNNPYLYFAKILSIDATTINIDANCKFIGSEAFEWDTHIETITIPDSVIEICPLAFYDADVREIIFGKKSQLKSIGDFAFMESSLESMVLPASVTSIGANPFLLCRSHDISVDENNNSFKIIDGILYTADGKTLVASIIDDHYDNLEIQNTAITIGAFAFYECHFDGEIVIPASVTTIESGAFHYSSRLIKVSFEDGSQLTSIGLGAFGSSSDLMEITLPNSLTTIEYGAFYDCENLTVITIPSSVTFIGEDAFDMCDSLIIYCEAEGKPIGWASDWNSECPVVWDCNNGGTSEDGYIYTVIEGIRYGLKDGEAKVASSQNKNIQTAEIPEMLVYNGNIYSVTSIDANAFKNCDALTYVSIPNSIIFIGNDAFEFCSDLQYNNKGDGLNYLGNSTNPYLYLVETLFNDVTNVKIDQNCKIIASSVFFGCSDLISVEIPNTIISIGDWAFSGCESLTSVVIPNSVITIGDWAFNDCNSLASVVIGESVTSIGSFAFNGCFGLISVVVGEGVTSIGDWSFTDCYKLVEVVNKSKHIAVTKGSSDNGYIGYYALSVSNCDDSYVSKLSDDNGCIIYTEEEEKILVGYIGSETSLVLPLYITQIYERAFYECTKLNSVVIGDLVTSIGNYAFYDCNTLNSISIPNSVTTIGDYAFYYCDQLVIYCEIASKPEGWSSFWKGDANVVWDCNNNEYTENGYILVNINGINYAINESGAKVTKQNQLIETAHIPSTVEYKGNSYAVISIESGAFYDCNALTSVTIPNSVTFVGDDAFYNCNVLTSVTIPNSVTFIGDGAFYNCNALTSVVIPNSVTFIGDDVFRNCYGLEYNVKDNLMYLGNDSNPYLYLIEEEVRFADGSQTVVIAEGCKFIGNMVFYNCNSITSVIIPNTVTSIGDSAFASCASLALINIPDSVISIGYSAFASCTLLGSVEIGDGVTTISERAFAGCDSLTSITIPDSVTFIGYYAFDGCEALTRVVLGSGIQFIDATAFIGCYSLTNMTISEDNEAFKIYNGNLYSKDGKVLVLCVKDKESTSFVIPEGVTIIGDYAFYDNVLLEGVKIPASVTSIGDYAFGGCLLLNSVIFEKNSQLETIGDYAFYGCHELKSITIPASVKAIGSAFYYCTLLENVIFEEGSKLTTIGKSAFSDCKSLVTIEIPDSVTTIKDGAFYLCTSLSYIVIPKSVVLMEGHVFTNLTNVNIYCEVESVPEGWNKSWNYWNCPVYWYSETQPNEEGNYWHYGKNGEVVVW